MDPVHIKNMESGWTIETLKQYYDALLGEYKASIEKQFVLVNQRFEQSEKAVMQALVAHKELYETVQTSSDKAITKAEEAQRTYNTGHNDLSRKMESQYKDMIPRPEADSRDRSMNDKLDNHRKDYDDKILSLHRQFDEKFVEQGKLIGLLKSGSDKGEGKTAGVALVISAIVSVLAILGFLIEHFNK